MPKPMILVLLAPCSTIRATGKLFTTFPAVFQRLRLTVQSDVRFTNESFF